MGSLILTTFLPSFLGSLVGSYLTVRYHERKARKAKEAPQTAGAKSQGPYREHAGFLVAPAKPSKKRGSARFEAWLIQLLIGVLLIAAAIMWERER